MIAGYFKEILDTYIESISLGKFNKNHEMFKLINYTSTDALKELVKDYNLTARGSCGAGGWTRYPWIAVYNEEITTTIQKGVYIVYLFSQDMSRVYLTLNQGCTVLKKDLGIKAARDSMINCRNEIRGIIKDTRFIVDNELIVGNADYEIGSIYYKEYLRDNFPTQEEFMEDLYFMIKIYDKYYNDIFLRNKNISQKNKISYSEGNIMKNNIRNIERYIKSKGFIFSYEAISNFYLSLKTKPFLILAGISGTGKSRLVKLFSEAINATNTNGRYRIISVKPDWNDSTELLGYKNINDCFICGPLTSIISEASKPENIDMPYIICLDEMNLARVEYYLSEYLSIIESRDFDERNRVITDRIFPGNYLNEDSPYSKLTIPENIFIIGTVNMDDTTFAFSRKVLDRANTIEFSEVKLEELEFIYDDIDSMPLDNSIFKSKFISIKDALKVDKDYVVKINTKIIEINNILSATNRHFGYRVRDEIIFYMMENKLNNLLDEDLAFDYQILQKILPTISGSDTLIKEILIDLYNFCNPGGQISSDIDHINLGISNLDTSIYMNSAKKILLMLRGYEDGFASFW